MRGFNFKKATQLLNYLAILNNGSMNKMKAIKMVWLADRLHLRKYGRMITSDVYFALPYGPVPSTTRNLIENNKDYLIEIELEYCKEYLQNKNKHTFASIKSVNSKVFSQTDVEIIENVFQTYNKYNEFQLSELSHTFPEWKKYEEPLTTKIASRFEININDFFKNVDDGTGLFIDSEDNIEITKEIFFENCKVSSFL